ncbi:MAG: N-acetyl-gamma-glutamyl-phosphate reductase [Epulopiscium sp.]|jgi:N-acetyl-gamma-glutamyl-phosphate reductase|nr:N-acetyl-gamma-glutamyl-phosphate reductase [Candidatus Epulonipiscium sp.]HOQ17198.1 N-acetyl-gamma-glutamyl-phosphate reductase [Defluviitaleaceae bacterium]HPT76323.1 N-acetyl-gamma-glutamyl-phosphate reductase [Defluviitaleaceae bacterium]
MKKYKVFVDGQTGTTGLQIHERLKKHPFVELLTIDYDKRKDTEIKKKFLNEADIVFLCLPDDAARESAKLVSNPTTKIIDPSVAHRVADGWTYGMPELSKEQREKIRESKRVTVPGCHASAFILAVAPLVKMGLMPSDYPVTAHSITGYSGGGKSLIEKYENEEINAPYIKAPRPYGLNLNHKHLPEMKVYTGLDRYPVFLPVVSNYYKGLAVSVPIHNHLLNKKAGAKDIAELLSEYYKDECFVKVMPYNPMDLLFDGAFDITACNDTNQCEIFVFGNDEKEMSLIFARLDNLGKGASGAAVQNMNIVLGLPEETGLES